MHTKEVLIKEIEKLPENKIDKALSLIRLLNKNKEELEAVTFISEEKLAEEWLTEEEDKAWKHL